MSITVGSGLDRSLDAGVERLVELQKPGGWWVGELESNVTMTAQHLLMLEFLRLRDEETTRRCANELLARQRPDGLWAIYWGGEPDLPATLESYAALRLAGLSADDERLAAARRFCEERGGIGGARVFTRIWLALFGLWPWEEIPQLPPELVFLRSGMPFSLYTFACWARQTVVPLTVVLHHRPVRNLPPERACHELNLGPVPRERSLGLLSDRALAWYGGRCIRPGPSGARPGRAVDLDRQELDGSWGGIQPPWVWSLIALACSGARPGVARRQARARGLEPFPRRRRRPPAPEACQSPVWDSALGGSPALRRARTARPVSQTGDWHASGRRRSPSSTRKRFQPSSPAGRRATPGRGRGRRARSATTPRAAGSRPRSRRAPAGRGSSARRARARARAPAGAATARTSASSRSEDVPACSRAATGPRSSSWQARSGGSLRTGR